MKVSRKCKIILQHQADVPFKKKKIFQKIADRYIDGYLFASIDLAEEWIKAGIIRDKKKCFELPASSSVFLHKNKQEARNELNIAEGNIFLWVGRLNKNKDPLTVLKAFEKFFLVNTEAQLYMIYHEDDLLADIKKKINENYQIKERVHLVGKVQHTEMATWYSAADFYISGSRREGGSFALTEAMACGCIPIVTEIPASLTAIQNGAYGLHYHPGNVNELFKKLLEAIAISKEEFSDKIQKYFKEELSAKAVANRLNNIIQNLLTE
ncbi:MAG TPA: glycosyltransferase family 4 protein [Chitinophagaceae bacterium]|nr:glycosyltransferase family 4 protein [Chitinophagaceae bacterium]